MTTLSSAADVLRCLSADRPHLTVTTAAELLGVPKSTASRLLRAMLEAGFLETVGDSKKYRPGLLLYEAGRLYRDSSSLIERAAAVVARISGATGHTGYVSKREGRDIVAVTDHPGTNALRVSSSIGRRLEAFASATGRTLLARMSDEDVRKLYSGPLTCRRRRPRRRASTNCWRGLRQCVVRASPNPMTNPTAASAPSQSPSAIPNTAKPSVSASSIPPR